jgi:hypothetical protein
MIWVHLITLAAALSSVALQVAAMRAKGHLHPVEQLRRKRGRRPETRPPSLTQLP